MIQSIVIEGKVIRVIFDNHTVVIYETNDVESLVQEIIKECKTVEDLSIIKDEVTSTDKNEILYIALEISFLRQDILMELGEYNRNDKLLEIEEILHRIYQLHIEKYIEILRREKGNAICYQN